MVWRIMPQAKLLYCFAQTKPTVSKMDAKLERASESLQLWLTNTAELIVDTSDVEFSVMSHQNLSLK
jgi:hypothetical protein